LEQIVLIEAAVDFEILKEPVPGWASKGIDQGGEIFERGESIGVQAEVEYPTRELEKTEEERGGDGGEGGEVEMEVFQIG